MSVRFFRLAPRLLPIAGICLAALTCAAARTDVTPIAAVQGAGDVSPLLGQSVTCEGIVTGAFVAKNGLKGFYLQAEKQDGDPATSDGVFVYLGQKTDLLGAGLAPGKRVRVSGKVAEYQTATQLENVTTVELLGEAPVPAPEPLQFPLTRESLEPLEGMLVQIPQELSVTAQHDLEKYGAIWLNYGGKLQVPGNVKPAIGVKTDNSKTTLLLDDGSDRRNPNPTPYLDTIGTRRSGDVVKNLTGVITFSHDSYRLHPTSPPVFVAKNPRPAAPPKVGGTITVGGANLYNYWTTLANKDNPLARGARSQPEFQRQAAKIVSQLKGLNADIVGLMEVENNGSTAMDDLVGRLNAAYGSQVYAAVADPATGTGTDSIKVALIYKRDAVTPVGASASAANRVFERFPVAQTFKAKSGGTFTVVVNHFKSKGDRSNTAAARGDGDEGEGAWNNRRVEQAKALVQFIETLKKDSGDPDVLAIGDFNAYCEEKPLQTLRNAGLSHLNLRVPLEERYSYAYDGRFGSLDHGMTTPTLDKQVTGFGEWHINADEPHFLGYRSLPVASFRANPYRASDHDPFLVGLNLTR